MSGALVLIGLSGSGKSTVGRLVACRLGMPFVDTDRIIEEQAGRTIAQIFTGDGEESFRKHEEAAVALACGAPRVVAVGGGAVLCARSRRAMRRGNVVAWLDLPLAALARRLVLHTQGEERPLLHGDVESRLRELSSARRALYAETAHIRIGSRSGRPLGSQKIAVQLVRVYRTWCAEEHDT